MLTLGFTSAVALQLGFELVQLLLHEISAARLGIGATRFGVGTTRFGVGTTRFGIRTTCFSLCWRGKQMLAMRVVAQAQSQPHARNVDC